MKTIGIYAGTFDPLTNGHIDIIKRSFKFCDHLIVAIGINPDKKTMFTQYERFVQIKTALIDSLGASISPYNWDTGYFPRSIS